MMTSDESSEEGLQSQALPIGPLPKGYNPSKAPTSAEEFLHHVVWEASQCEEVVTVELAPHKLKRHSSIIQKQEKASAPQEFIPTLETQQELMAAFSKLRIHIAALKASDRIPSPPFKLPGTKKREEWCKLCFGNSFQLSLLEKANNDTTQPPLVEGQQPLLSILLNITQQLVQNLLEWHTQWLEVLGFSKAQGCWFYALLACLEKPLTPESCSQIRHVARMCAKIRAALPSADHPHLPQLNMLICIITRYFSQEDLADR